jgi:hypothetical protein
MQAAIDELIRKGESIEDSELVHLSPIRFQHINRYGRFRFDIGDDVASSGLRPLRSD